MATDKTWRGVRLTGAVNSAQVRFGTLLGVEYVVAPIVLLLGDAVIFPINAEHPEFVPADVLSVAPGGWNGRPAMSGDHPAEEGSMVSANTPSIIERQAFGQLFTSRFENNRLQSEVWINPVRAAAVPDGLEILQRIRDGKPVEISVGAFVVTEESPGTAPNGAEYGSIWREMIPDHVALLREGLVGACSVDMGCGTPRIAVQHHCVDGAVMRVMTASEVNVLTTPAAATADAAAADDAAAVEVPVPIDIKDKILSALAQAQLTLATGMSDQELRDLLTEALKRVEPQLVGIQSVVPDDTTVVYLIDPDPGGPMPLRPYQRSYTLASDGRVTFSEERVPVRSRTEWVPVTAQAAPAAAEATEPAAAAAAHEDCGCGGRNRNVGAASAGGATMNVNAERITALIENPRSPFEEADRAYLGTLSAERIAAAEAQAAAPPPAAAPTAEEEAAAAATAAAAAAAAAGAVQIDAAELAELRRLASVAKADRAARKRALVGQLKTAQTTYPEARLLAMEVEQLQEIASLLSLHVQSQPTEFVGLERVESTEAPEPPKPYTLALARRNGSAA
jgi:Uncharacterized protein conserved in bacteria (DUF2213)